MGQHSLALSRIEINAISPTIIELKAFALTQSTEEELLQLLESDNSSLKISEEYFPLEEVYLYCDMSQKQPRSFVRKSMRHLLFHTSQVFSHPSIAASNNLIVKRFV
ncbi:transposon Ty3-I Gag-Pol polyprotein [Nephila pilipes]|uniref:Transposon Ty3-I Gag-Pol polyprotein n=1 Tax=Nephila pilipes TaxID=299642 RepID=A0A8X6NJV1_NEPPI|nr:transposon Ty3-I Gag-Pol polyprotein [Nephila pilipes]